MKKRYKILSVILALAIILGSIVTISVFSTSAEQFTDENGISWTVTENYPGWAIKPSNLSEISGEITIPATYNDKVITAIDDNAFKNCINLTKVTVPNGVCRIGTGAFGGCSGLTSIIIPNSVNNIQNGAFQNCSSLSSFDFNNNLKNIPKLAFKGCTQLSSISIPDSITSIGSEAFRNCTGLTSVDFGNGVQTILGGAFNGCTGLTSISIPNSVTDLDGFTNCTGLTSIDIPDSVISLGGFEGCTGITSIDIPNSVITIKSSAFRNCTGLTGELNIPNSVLAIESSAFNGCKNLTSVIIPSSVQTIGAQAFLNCSSLNNLSITESTKFQDYTFPNSLVPIKTMNWNNYTDSNGCMWEVSENQTGYTIKPYNSSLLSSTVTIPESYNGKPITEIYAQAFYQCTNLQSVVIPDTIITIGVGAFQNCVNLSSLKLGNSVETIGNGAFNGCTGLTSIDIPNSVKRIETMAFKGCTGLTAIDIPNSVTYLSGFKNCINLESITIPNSVLTIGSDAFGNCTKLISINIPNSVTHIENDAFSQCTNLAKVDLGNNVTAIGKKAFYECENLSSITFPDSVTSLGDSAFYYCSKLESVKFGNSITNIGDGAFSFCTGISGTLELPSTINTISDNTFNNCVGLTSVTIPNSVTHIGKNAFRYCSNLLSISIPNSVTFIDDSAFRYCSKAFDSITIGSNITYVGDYAFANLGELDTLTIKNKKLSDISIVAFYADTFKNLEVAETVEEINTPLLSGNKNFASVGLGSNITNITENAFFGNSNMNIVTTPNANVVIDYANKNNIPFEFGNVANVNKPVDFEVTCDKSGYEFTVYRVADLEAGSNPYVIRYDSLITEIEDEIFEGDSVAMLEELDKIDSSVFTEVVGTYNTDVDGSSKIFEDLPAGIYYVRATNFPANVYSVQNSVFALPYYTAEDGWIYELSPIPLATKVDESNPEIVKTITNSTKDNVNFTDVSLGDTVNFEIEASRVGSANVVESKDFKLKSYVVSDIMESGLTLNQDSFVVTLEDIDGNTLATLENTTDYVVNIVANEGADTTFTVSLTPEYLAQDEFYSSANVVIAYSAVLNKYSTREFDGNFNTATDLTYSNKTNVTSTVEGNTVYAYTFGIEVNKYDDAGTPLAGSEFGLYLTEDDAKFMKNAIATGTSTDTGKVEFFTESNDVIRLASGTYYIVETKATENYNRYTDVIPVTITAEYSDTETNGTYLLSAPENGIQLVEVKNSKVVIPNTGGDGAMYRYLIALAFAMLAVTLVVIKKRSTKKATATK